MTAWVDFGCDDAIAWMSLIGTTAAVTAYHQAYVLQALAVVFQATGDAEYLHRLTCQVDGVLARAQRAAIGVQSGLGTFEEAVHPGGEKCR